MITSAASVIDHGNAEVNDAANVVDDDNDDDNDDSSGGHYDHVYNVI